MSGCNNCQPQQAYAYSLNGYGRMLGLVPPPPSSTGGGVDPATITAIMQAVVHAKDLWNDLKAIFGVGAGAREADAITPTQDQILHTFLAPATDFIVSVKTASHTPTCSEIQTWTAQEKAVETQWLKLLHETDWQDGRAASQAEATLAPYFTNIKNDLASFTQHYCGSTGSIITDAQGNLNWPLIAVGGGLLFLLARRK